ncbi:hypothetical protein BS50DRAFT_406330 [Corynespora cassiicola Philippines]|uniref:Uncharacterized protein n=1 Tax=Corynespora cassiicola Philippines TaxID=1448308 RepID=A0A2T2NKX1_CORCC|nr:hypothetical protein BS50DRAFT_406330 [Corynespora cassiicola Philippines]
MPLASPSPSSPLGIRPASQPARPGSRRELLPAYQSQPGHAAARWLRQTSERKKQAAWPLPLLLPLLLPLPRCCHVSSPRGAIGLSRPGRPSPTKALHKHVSPVHDASRTRTARPGTARQACQACHGQWVPTYPSQRTACKPRTNRRAGDGHSKKQPAMPPSHPTVSARAPTPLYRAPCPLPPVPCSMRRTSCLGPRASWPQRSVPAC